MFFLFGRVACFVFCCLGGGRVPFFAVWAGGRVFVFAVWAEVVFFFLLFGRESWFFLLFGGETGGHSLTGLPGSSLKDPRTKKTKQEKK